MKHTVQQLKSEATAYQLEAKAAGSLVKRSKALDTIARRHGYSNWRAAHAACNANRSDSDVVPTSEVPRPQLPATRSSDEYETWVVRRSGDTPLRFRGLILGEATEQKRDNDYYCRTTLYRTIRGKYVGERVFDIISIDRPERRAEQFSEAPALIAWLREDDGKMSAVTLQALSVAAEADEEIGRAFGEDVE